MGSVDWLQPLGGRSDPLPPVFGSRGNRQPRQILFRIQILSKSRGVRDDQSMTTQQHQLVQNQVSKAQLSIHGSGWFYSGHSGFHPFLKKKKPKKKPNLKKKKKKKKKS